MYGNFIHSKLLKKEKIKVFIDSLTTIYLLYISSWYQVKKKIETLSKTQQIFDYYYGLNPKTAMNTDCE